jgi:hypothetical protein
MRPTKESGKILKGYVKLAKKLKKLPTRTEIEKNLVSERQIRKYFDNLTNLRNLALKTNEDLLKFTNSQKTTELQIIYKVLEGVK